MITITVPIRESEVDTLSDAIVEAGGVCDREFVNKVLDALQKRSVSLALVIRDVV